MRRRRENSRAIARLWYGGLGLFFVLALGGYYWAGSVGSHAPAQTSLRGQQAYEANCAACHDATDLHLAKTPPKLEGLFRKPALPSGAAATDANVKDVILHGRGIMPPFEQTLNSDDVNALLQYLHTK